MPSESERQRLPPISLFFGIGKAAWAFVLPVGLLVLTQGIGSVWYAIFLLPALMIPGVTSSVLKYLSFSYQLGIDEMVIREGILRRNERHIPYARIQNIDLLQNPLHRLFKVAVVRLETASGGKPEAVISVLTLPVVEDMRARVFSDRGAAPAAEAGEPAAVDRGPLLELSLKELAIFGAISNKGLVVVAAVFGLAVQTGYFDPETLESQFFFSGSSIPDLAAPGSPLLLVALAVLALVAIIVLLRLFSIILAILKFYGFRLERLGDDLRAEYGLLTKVTATIPRHRIQLVTVNLTPLHRLFNRASVQVDTAGGGAGSDQKQQGGVQERQWLAPVIERLRALDLLRDVMPESRLEQVDWQPISPRAWRRVFKRWLILLLLVVAASFFPTGGWSTALALVGLPLAVVHARLYTRRTGYALTPAAVLYRSGAWVRRVSIVPFVKIQVLGLRQTPFDRRNRMATVQVDTAGATLGGHRVTIGYLDLEDADQVLQRLDMEASRTAFRW